MALLKSEPAGSVRTLGELFAIAYELERAAAERYDEFAERMRMQGNVLLAELFERLACEERKHVESVVRWSESQEGRRPDPARAPWRPPETMDVEGTDVTEPRLLTPYRALSVAVRNEERAFVFWTYVAAHAERSEVRQAAEGMARAELEHVALLRRQRRRAYHVARDAVRAPDSATIERRLASLLERAAALAEGETAIRLGELAAQARAVADEFAATELPPPGPGIGDEAFDAAVAGAPAVLAELLVDRYLEAADASTDETRIAKAQSLAAMAIERLAWLRTMLPPDGSRAPD